MCQVDQSDSPRWPDDLVVQDTNLMHLPSTVFTFNKPESWEKSLSKCRGVSMNRATRQMTHSIKEHRTCSCWKTGPREKQSRWMKFSFKKEVQSAGSASEWVPQRVDQLQKSEHALLSNTCRAPCGRLRGASPNQKQLSHLHLRVRIPVAEFDLRFGVEHVVLLALKLIFWYPPKKVIKGETTRNNC